MICSLISFLSFNIMRAFNQHTAEHRRLIADTHAFFGFKQLDNQLNNFLGRIKLPFFSGVVGKFSIGSVGPAKHVRIRKIGVLETN